MAPFAAAVAIFLLVPGYVQSLLRLVPLTSILPSFFGSPGKKHYNFSFYIDPGIIGIILIINAVSRKYYFFAFELTIFTSSAWL